VAPRFTFAVVGHNEEATLPLALSMAHGAAEPGDTVLLVDSASTDGSAELACRLGAQVLHAPIGKGRAMQAALDACTNDFICYLDADYEHSEHNIPSRLRQAATGDEFDMVVGSYSEPARRRCLTPYLYVPLLTYLFPEIVTHAERVPLSGFRVLRTSFDIGRFPPGYGVETYLNIEAEMRGGRTTVCQVGTFQGKLRNYVNIVDIGRDMTTTILDRAVAHGRMAPERRGQFQAWIDAILDTISRQPFPGEPDADWVVQMKSVADRPLPSTGTEADERSA
jgi:glucosyl-3-phosphoglycerate synthase